MLLNSFMEKVEKNLVSNNIGKNVISASKILELTLEDYHESRKIYDNKDTKQLISQQHQKILQNSEEQNSNNNNQINNTNSKGNQIVNNTSEKDTKLGNMKNLTFEFIKETHIFIRSMALLFPLQLYTALIK